MLRQKRSGSQNPDLTAGNVLPSFESLAQLVEREPVKLLVPGSTPGWLAKKLLLVDLAQLVERRTVTSVAAGSKPAIHLYMTTTTSHDRFEALYREMRELQDQGKLPAKVTREQAIDWAYGNIALHNPDVTRETVAAAYDARHPKPCLHLVPPREARVCFACGVALRGRELSEARTRRAILAKADALGRQAAPVKSQPPVATRPARPRRRSGGINALFLASLAMSLSIPVLAVSSSDDSP